MLARSLQIRPFKHHTEMSNESVQIIAEIMDRIAIQERALRAAYPFPNFAPDEFYVNIIDFIADELGVPQDNWTAVTEEEITPDMYCRDWLYNKWGEIVEETSDSEDRKERINGFIFEMQLSSLTPK